MQAPMHLILILIIITSHENDIPIVNSVFMIVSWIWNSKDDDDNDDDDDDFEY